MSRDKNRAEFPGLAALVDAAREHFPEVRLMHGEENGREIGKRPADQLHWVDITRGSLLEEWPMTWVKRGR